MAGMKRFVTYIYAYEEEKKGSNVGFARHAECICSSGKRQAGRKQPV